MKNKEKILTALINKEYLNIIKNCDDIEIIGQDIQYKEGIIERLELEEEIDKIFINKKLPGKIKYNELIEKIKNKNKKIKIILIKKREDIEEYIENKGENKIIAYLGAGGVGKSTVISEIIKNTSNNNKRILIIDRNKNDNSISIIFNIKKTNEKIIKIKENCYFYNKEIDDKEILKKRKIYERIFIEIHNEKKEYNLLKKVDEVFIIIENNLLTIYKSNKILNNLKKIGIGREKIKIIINNKNKINIEKNIIERIFYGYKIFNIKQIKSKRRLRWNWI